ncbi:MAG: hypothetical protein JNK82_43915 [Myxococcaceae bacterium]|nr:hypothetical protein [Myxococcaceae bacterium]
MSLLPDSASFHERVQDLFAAFRGVGVSLSGLDVELVDAWEKTGAPFEVVARGIRRAAETAWMDAAETDRGLRSLAACRRSVQLELDKFARASIGGRPEEPAPDDTTPFHLVRHKKLGAALRKVGRELPALQPVTARLLALTPPADFDGAQWHQDLAHAALLRALPFDQRLTLLQQARDVVQKSPPMSGSARREARRLHRSALLRRHLSLPAFW